MFECNFRGLTLQEVVSKKGLYELRSYSSVNTMKRTNEPFTRCVRRRGTSKRLVASFTAQAYERLWGYTGNIKGVYEIVGFDPPTISEFDVRLAAVTDQDDVRVSCMSAAPQNLYLTQGTNFESMNKVVRYK